jgi:hypothetical protein
MGLRGGRVLESLATAVLGGLIGAALPTLLFYRFRGRIARSTVRLIAESAPKETEELILGIFFDWEDKKNDKGEVVRTFKPKPMLISFLASVMPAAVEIAWAAFGSKLSGLPLGTDKDGNPKLNFLAGPMKKMMEGKKIKFDDFVPELINRALPLVEQMAQKFGGAMGVQQAPGSPAPTAAQAPKPGGGFKPV